MLNDPPRHRHDTTTGHWGGACQDKGHRGIVSSDVHGFVYPCGLAGTGLTGTGTGQPKFPRGQPAPVAMDYGISGRYCRSSPVQYHDVHHLLTRFNGRNWKFFSNPLSPASWLRIQTYTCQPKGSVLSIR